MSRSGDLRKGSVKGTDALIGVLVLLIAAAVIEYLLSIHVAIFSGTLLMIAALSLFIAIRVFAPGYSAKVAPDERIKKTRAKAIMHSWGLTIAFMIGLQLATNIGKLELTASWSLTTSLLVAVYSFLILSWYYGRKPDVELV